MKRRTLIGCWHFDHSASTQLSLFHLQLRCMKTLQLQLIKRLAEMEAKLRVLLDDRIEKLFHPLGIPPTVEELQTVVKETFGVSDEFSLQYLDSEFEDYFTLHKSDQIKHKDTIKVVQAAPIILNLLPHEESLDSSFGQQSNSSYAGSNEESSPGTTSSSDTIILPRRSPTERSQPWPKQFPIPQFAYETEMYLERANEDYTKNGTLLTTSKVKTDILEKLAGTIYTYRAYPSSAQISDVAEVLVKKYPCLKEPGSFSGYYGWQQSIKYKMANYRTKLQSYGVPEVMCNALKRKSPADQKSAKGVKKPRMAEASHIEDEFQRITRVHLESKFMSKLDEYTPKLLNLFQSKGGTMGLRLQAILLKAPSNPSINEPRTTDAESPAGDSACGTPRRFFGGGPIPLCLKASVVRGAFFLLDREGGVRRRCGRRAVGGDRVRRSAAATLDACRALLADHLSYGARWGNPPFARGAPSGGAPRLAPSSQNWCGPGESDRLIKTKHREGPRRPTAILSSTSCRHRGHKPPS
ncbi:unnamed protein product [Pleuronectes platessa]|uniref:Uncharacterized protein n=1 Tax=Pleuronectes platessa TaxID=8262 RepID=A0A9N7TYP0_PLEPL|nr:unnamed protein product [Pleuronectes platessa]